MTRRLDAELPVQLDETERRPQELLELLRRELAFMERVRRPALFGARRRDDERAAGPENASCFEYEPLRLGEMLDGLERAHRVEAAVVEWELLDVPDRELDVRSAVAFACVGDGLLVSVDTEDAARNRREVCAPIADAAARIENVAPAAMRECELVALQVQRHDPRLGCVRHDPFRNAHKRKVSLAPALADFLRGARLERAIQIALVTFVVTAVLAGGAILSWVSPAAKIRWGVLAALLALAAIWAWRAREKPLDRPLFVAAALVVLTLLSAVWCATPRTTVAHALGFGAVIAVAALLAHATAGRPEAVEAVAAGIVGAAAAVVIGGLLVLAFRYERAVQPATTVSPARYQGLGGGPNLATMVLGVATPLAAYFTLFARTLRGRALAGAVLAGVLASIAFSGSRGALAAAFTGLFVFAITGFSFPRRAAGAAAAVGVVLAATLALVALPSRASANPPQPTGVDPNPPGVTAAPGYIDANVSGVRIQDDIGHPGPGVAIDDPGRTLAGSSGRVEAWRGALGQVADRPTVGYGFGTEDKVFQDRYVFFNSNVPENSFIGLLLQLGIVGLAVFVVVPVLLAVRTWRAVPRLGARWRALAAALGGTVAGGLALALFQSYVYAPGNNATLVVWVAALLLLSLTARAPEHVG
jgi:hypothetical protein